MSQTVWGTINPAATSGTQLATLLNDFKNAMMSGLSGTARPTQTTAGGMWVDTTNGGSPNFYWSLMLYDGTTDIEIIRINLATGTPSVTGASSVFNISRISDDTVGALLKLVKERIATTDGRINDGDTLGAIQWWGHAEGDTDKLAAYIEAVATDDFDGTLQGVDLKFYSTVDGASAATEVMRVRNGFLGIGKTNPTAKVHAYGPTGVKSEYEADSANGAKVVLSKSRASLGPSDNGDTLGDVDFETTDDATTKAVSARVSAIATEDHTAAAQGTALSVKTIDNGTNSLTEKVNIGSKVETIVTLTQNASELVAQSVATAATIAQLSAAKAVVELTGATPTEIQGINSAHASKVVLIHNRSTANISILHEDAGATAADRITLPSGTITVLPQASIEFYYCVADSRWKVKSSAGGGGAGGGIPVEFLFGSGLNSPVSSIADEEEVLEFEENLNQEVAFSFRVPDGYIAGSQIVLKGTFKTPLTTGNILFNAVSTLRRTGTDPSDDTTNQHSSTNSAITVNGTANVITEVSIDLTDVDGLINSVAVSAGDRIAVKLKRDSSDTGVGNAYLYRYGWEVAI